MDEDLLPEFFIDTQAHIEAVEEDLLKLENAPADMGLIDDVFRRVHSVKGNAGMLGLTSIHSVGQTFESFLGKVRERKAAVEGEVDLMFQSLDALKAAVAAARGDREPEEPAPPKTPAPAPEAPPARAALPEEGELIEAAPEKEPAGKAEPPPAAPPPAEKQNEQAAAPPKPRDETVTFLVFDLSGERYGLEITKVREIILMEAITPVPNTKPFVTGVMNLRDQVIAVFDLKKKLGMAGENGRGSGRNIIVVDISKEATGLMVDEVTGIVNLKRGDITDPEDFHGAIPTAFLYGMGRAAGQTVILLKADDICDPDEILYQAKDV